MSFLGPKSTGSKPQKLTTISVQTSAYGVCIPMVWGTPRLTGNLIWFGDFVATEYKETQGGKGGGVTSTSYTYSTAFALGLASGTIVAVPRVWAAKSRTSLAELGLDLMTGAAGQAPWSYLSARHSDQALNYPGLAYVGAGNFQLGDSASMPNLAFEVTTGTAGAGNTPDAAPWTIVSDLASAGGLPSARLDSLTAYTNFCGANGLFLSPALTEQKRAADHIQDILDMTHTAAVASEGLVKLVPYGDTAATGNGYTFTPNTAPIYALSDDDFLPLDGKLPIRIKRKAPSDAKNRLRVEFKDRGNEYANGIAEASDEAHIAQFGARPQETLTFEAIKTAAVASKVAYLKLQRGLYVLNTYEFRLSWRFCLLEPMDVVSMTHSLLGMNQLPVRIISIDEDAQGALTVVAEDFPQGTGQAPVVPPQPPSGYSIDMNVAPGNAATPTIFEPPISLAGQPEVWMATSGGDTYGGCDVWVSLDNVTYQMVGTLSGKSRHGITTATLPLVGDPDTTSTLAVDLSVSGGELLGGTDVDRDLYTTLVWVGGEFVSYKDAALTGVNRYALAGLRRGVYGSTIAAHSAASKVVRCDDRVFRYPYDPAIIGKTLYVKLQAFNIYGGAHQDLAALTPTAYVVQGAPLGTVSGLVLEQPFVGTACSIKWAAYPGASSYTVEVWSGGVKRRTVTGLGAPRYTYGFEDSKADGGPYRNIELRVFAVAANGTSGTAAVITASNPQLGAPTGIATVGAGASISISANKPTAADYGSTRVWLSSTSGFEVASTAPAYDGPDTAYTAMGLAAGTWYARIAQYDVFGADGLATSGELAIVVTGASGVRTVTSLPTSPAVVDGQLAVFLDVSDVTQRGIWGWDGSAWKFTRDGANLVANSIAADRLAVSNLSAITANMGAVTSGSFTVDAAGFIAGGQTGYKVGAGFWLGYLGGAYKLSIGNSTQSLTWDGNNLTMSGALNAATGTFTGSLSGADISGATGIFTGRVAAGSLDVSQLAGTTSTYTSPGGPYYVDVPAGFTSVKVTIRGGGGGGGGGNGYGPFGNVASGGGGGQGGLTVLTFTNVAAGTSITSYVGGGGGGGGGGTNGEGPPYNGSPGGSGGASSVTILGSSYSAGGGGGGGGASAFSSGAVVDGSSGAGGSGGGAGATGASGSGASGGASGSIGGGGAGGNGPYAAGVAGLPGAVTVEMFNPNGVVLRTEWTSLMTNLTSRFGYTWP